MKFFLWNLIFLFLNLLILILRSLFSRSLLSLFTQRESLFSYPRYSTHVIHFMHSLFDSWSLTNKKWVIWFLKTFKKLCIFNFVICPTGLWNKNKFDWAEKSRAQVFKLLSNFFKIKSWRPPWRIRRSHRTKRKPTIVEMVGTRRRKTRTMEQGKPKKFSRVF